MYISTERLFEGAERKVLRPGKAYERIVPLNPMLYSDVTSAVVSEVRDHYFHKCQLFWFRKGLNGEHVRVDHMTQSAKAA